MLVFQVFKVGDKYKKRLRCRFFFQQNPFFVFVLG
jgi:hypothetical protein